MALETLKGVKQIGNFEVFEIKGGKALGEFPGSQADPIYITINHDTNTISLTIQNGPIKEHGVNGCQVDTIFELGKKMLEELNKKFPCRENVLAIMKADELLMRLRERTRGRELRGVEGTNQA